MNWLRALFEKHTVIRYIFVGGTAYVFELSTLLLVYHVSGSKSLAAAAGFVVGFALAFVLQKLVAFREFSKELRAIGRQGTLYTLLNVWNWVFTVVFVSIFPAKYLIVSRTTALIMMSCWNYVIYRKIIFRHKA